MNKEIFRNVFLGAAMAGRSKNEVFEQWELDSLHRPRFGFNWWLWWPSVRTNGGRFRAHENTDLNFHWLCFAVWLTVFSWKKEK
jgi:hypothetical protein